MKWTVKHVTQANQVFGLMKYRIICPLPDFFDVRSWCWEQFGPGIEHVFLLSYLAVKNNGKFVIMQDDPAWCWDCTKYKGSAVSNGHIYLQNDGALTLFSMRWS
jgi:hypothetical protein